ncbi:hypothetical protein SEA_SHAOBING_44 [Mycobacterium phage Shaobing]|nr:hypothetical protein SEA_SHAOBING_44 [Mycobacterium phage Shaobing]
MLDALNMTLRVSAIAVILAAVYYRRLSWRMIVPYEMGITLHLALQALGLWLSGPVPTLGLDALLLHLTGVPHLDNLLGPVCYVLGFGVLATNMLYRIADDDDDGHRMAGYGVLLPALGVGLPVMCASFIAAARPGASALLDMQPGMNMRIFECATFATVAWLALVACCALRIIATDRAQRQVARDWLLTLKVCFGASVLAVADGLTPGAGLGYLTWWGTAAVGVLTALIAARGWRRHMRTARTLLRATRTKRRELREDTQESHRLRIMLAAETILGPTIAERVAYVLTSEAERIIATEAQATEARGDDDEGRPLQPCS